MASNAVSARRDFTRLRISELEKYARERPAAEETGRALRAGPHRGSSGTASTLAQRPLRVSTCAISSGLSTKQASETSCRRARWTSSWYERILSPCWADTGSGGRGRGFSCAKFPTRSA